MVGWLAYLLHHSLIADAHRSEFSPVSGPGNLSFIEADGSLRPGHELFNDFQFNGGGYKHALKVFHYTGFWVIGLNSGGFGCYKGRCLIWCVGSRREKSNDLLQIATKR